MQAVMSMINYCRPLMQNQGFEHRKSSGLPKFLKDLVPKKIHKANHPRVDRAPPKDASQNDRRDILLLSLILSIRAFLRWNVRTRTKMLPTQLSNFRGHFHETRVQRRNHFVNHFLQTKKNSVCTVQ